MKKSTYRLVFFLITLITISAVIVGISWLWNQPQEISKTIQPFINKSKEKTQKNAIEIIAENLIVPWEVAFLPDGEILITERPGNLLKVKNKTVIPIQGVTHTSEGGLLGIAVHPDFQKNHWIYLYRTTQSATGLTNVVERYTLENTSVRDPKTIISGIAGAQNHDGGRIAFGPDGYLYVTTGDAQNEQIAQNTRSLNGKILRVKDDGSIPSDNPFGNAVYSYGHRNPQGITWDDTGNLWATEHGRSGVLSGLDELNKIEKGQNYGWPTIQGDQTKTGMTLPIIHSGNDTWAPSGAAFYLPPGRQDGRIFFSGLRGETLYEYTIADKSLKKHFQGKYGRIRAVIMGPDDHLYITTSNRDGRGLAKSEDDKLIKINPHALQ